MSKLLPTKLEICVCIDGGEDSVEGKKQRLSCDNALVVAFESNLAADECFLGVDFASSDTDCGLPILCEGDI